MKYLLEIRTEKLNFLTGILLILCGIINLSVDVFEMGMNWIIFGAMYLIMDDYVQNPMRGSLFEKMTDASRHIFSWVGLISSIILLFYYLLILY